MAQPCPHDVLRFYRRNIYYCEKCFIPLTTSITDHPSWDEMKDEMKKLNKIKITAANLIGRNLIGSNESLPKNV